MHENPSFEISQQSKSRDWLIVFQSFLDCLVSHPYPITLQSYIIFLVKVLFKVTPMTNEGKCSKLNKNSQMILWGRIGPENKVEKCNGISTRFCLMDDWTKSRTPRIDNSQWKWYNIFLPRWINKSLLNGPNYTK